MFLQEDLIVEEDGKITIQSNVQPVTVAGTGQFTTRDSGTAISDEEPAYTVFLSQSGPGP